MKTLEHIKKSTKLFIEQKPMGDKDLERLDTLVASLDEDGRISKADAIALTQPNSKNPLRGYENFISKVNASTKELLDELDDDYLLEVFKNFSLSTVQDDLLILAKVPLELQNTLMPNLTYDSDMFIDSSGVSNREIMIFISYASGDLLHKNLFIERLEKQLNKSKIAFKLNVWEMKDIPIGVDFDKNIRDNLAECDYGFTLLSDNFIQSQYIMDIELPILLESDKIFPIGLVGSMSSIVSKIDSIKKRKQKSNAKELLNRNIFMLKDRVGRGDFFSTCATKDDQKLFVDELLNSLSHRKAFDTPKKKLLTNHTIPDKKGIYEECDFFDKHKGKLSEVRSAVEQSNDTKSKKDLILTVQIQQDLQEWLLDKQKYPHPLYALLGDFGMGKTFNLRIFALKLWKKYEEDKSSIIPFYIDLRDVDSFIYEGNKKRVPYIEETIEEILRQSKNSEYTAEEIIELHNKEKLVLIIDGLDEKLVHYNKEQQEKFLKELMMVISPQNNTHTKTVLSCRNHYFETAIKQNNFFLGQGRVGTKSSHYISIDILPLDKDEVAQFLAKRLTPVEVERVLFYISKDEYLGSIASRPFMLSKILELLPSLMARKESGEVLNRASFYDALIVDTFGRDEEKNQIEDEDKKYILKKLAFYMYKNSIQSISISALNKWFWQLIRKDERLEEYEDNEKDILKKELRNSTLLVRFGENDFGFSHSSIYEYFLSQYTLKNWIEVAGYKEFSTLTEQFILDSMVNFKQREREELLVKLLNVISIGSDYLVKFSFDLLSLLELEIDKIEINNINLTAYIFKDLKINYFYINNCILKDSQFINCKVQNVKVVNTNFLYSYFEDTRFININNNKCNWKGITLLNSILDLEIDVEHDYNKIYKNKDSFEYIYHNEMVPIRSIDISPHGDKIILGLSSNDLKLWNIKEKYLATFNGHQDYINSVKYSPNGEYIVSGSLDNTLKLWNLEGECLVTFEGHTDTISTVEFSFNGEYIISGSLDNTLKLWNFKGECLVTFEGHEGWIKAVSFNPKDNTIISSADDKSLKLWDIEGVCLITFQGNQNSIRELSFSPNGDTFIFISDNKNLKLSNIKGETLVRFEEHSSYINQVIFTSDGKYIVSCADDKSIKLWNLEGKCLSTFKHSSYVKSVRTNDNGETIIAGLSDGSIRIWDIKTKKEIAQMYHKDKEWYSFDFQNKTAKGTPMSWKLSTLTDENGDTFTIDKLKGFEVYRYDR